MAIAVTSTSRVSRTIRRESRDRSIVISKRDTLLKARLERYSSLFRSVETLNRVFFRIAGLVRPHHRVAGATSTSRGYLFSFLVFYIAFHRRFPSTRVAFRLAPLLHPRTNLGRLIEHGNPVSSTNF